MVDATSPAGDVAEKRSRVLYLSNIFLINSICSSQANSRRSIKVSFQPGVCKNGDPACTITVITDPTGSIVAAYPG